MGVMGAAAATAALISSPSAAQSDIVKRPDILLKPSCSRTRGGIAIAKPDGTVYYCLQRVVAIERRFPSATRFFFLHEYGHIALQTGDELKVDCWAAWELRNIQDGKKILAAARKYVEGFKLPDVKYGGTGAQRSELMQGCNEQGMPWLKKARERGDRPPSPEAWGE